MLVVGIYVSRASPGDERLRNGFLGSANFLDCALIWPRVDSNSGEAAIRISRSHEPGRQPCAECGKAEI